MSSSTIRIRKTMNLNPGRGRCQTRRCKFRCIIRSKVCESRMRTRHHVCHLLLTGICGFAAHLYLCVVALAGDAGMVVHADSGWHQVRLVVKATTEVSEASDLVAEFMNLNPEVVVQYSKISSTELFDQVVKPSGQNGSVDVAWSSAMDLQIKLANDGYAAEYRSAEVEGI